MYIYIGRGKALRFGEGVDKDEMEKGTKRTRQGGVVVAHRRLALPGVGGPRWREPPVVVVAAVALASVIFSHVRGIYIIVPMKRGRKKKGSAQLYFTSRPNLPFSIQLNTLNT